MTTTSKMSCRLALAGAVALGQLWGAPSWAQSVNWSPSTAGSAKTQNMAADLDALGKMGQLDLRAQGQSGASGAALWIKNNGGKTIREVHAVVHGMGGPSGQGKEIFFMRFQWAGSLEPKGRTLAGAGRFTMPGMNALPSAASLVIEPVYMLADDGAKGAPAPWSLGSADMGKLRKSLDEGVDADMKKAKAFAAAKGGKMPLVGSFAMLWGKPGENPYDPSSFRVGYEWLNPHGEDLLIDGALSTFYASPSLAPFLKADWLGRHLVKAGSRDYVVVGMGAPLTSDAARKAFEDKAKGHGVSVERGYVDPAIQAEVVAEAKAMADYQAAMSAKKVEEKRSLPAAKQR